MKRFFAGFGFIAAVGLLAAQQDPPEKKAPQKAKTAVAPAIRFNATPAAVVGSAGDTQAVAASKDGRRVASSGGSLNPATGFISVIDTESRKELLGLKTPRPFNSAGLSPDGKILAVTGTAGELKVIEVDSGKTLFTKQLGAAAQLAFAPDGKSIATVTQGKTLQIWDVPGGAERLKYTSVPAPLRCVAFSGDGKKLFAGGGETKQGTANGTILVYDIAKKTLDKKLETNSPAQVFSIAANRDGSVVVGVSNDFQVRVWDVANAKVTTELTPQQQVTGVAFAPDGKSVAASMGTGVIRLWNPANGEELGVLERHIGACRCVACD